MVRNSMRQKLRMRKLNIKRTVLQDAVPERRTKRYPIYGNFQVYKTVL